MLRFFAAGAASLTLAAVVVVCLLHADTWVVSDANVASGHRFFGYPLLLGALGTLFLAGCVIALVAASSPEDFPPSFWGCLVAIPVFLAGGFAFYALYSPPGFHESRGALDGYVEHVITEAEAADGVYDERFDPELRLGSVEIVFYDTDCFIGPCGWVYRSAGEPTSVRDAVPLGAGWFDFGR